MADEGETPGDRAYSQGLEKGTEAGKKAGKAASWTDLTPPVPEVPESPNDIEGSDNKQHYKDGYTDGYRDGYNEGWKSQHPVLTPVKVIWDLISHWLQRFFPNNPSTTTVQGMS